MFRYLGSDDEDSDDSNNVVVKNNDLCEDIKDLKAKKLEPKKKRKHLLDSELQDTEKDQGEPLKEEKYDGQKEVTEEKSPKTPKKKKLKVEKNIKEIDDQPLEGKKPKDKKNKESYKEIKEPFITSEKNFIPIGQVKVQNKLLKPALPKWMSNPTVFGTGLHKQEVSVSELSYLDENSKANLKSSKIDFLFPVQLAVIPWLIESMQSNLRCLYPPSDLCVSAPTGSGKTVAFALPIVQALKDRVVCAIRAVVVLPVSELAFQVFRVFKTFTQGTNLRVCILTGQKSFDAEKKTLVGSGIGGHFSRVDIVVTTPGRILDHINKTEGFSLEQLQYLVIDEADRMMQEIQQGWLKRVEEAVYKNSNLSSCVCSAIGGKRMPYVPVTVCQTMYVNEPLQKLLFSATLFHDPEKLHALSLYKPKLFTAQVNSNDTVGKCAIPDDLNLLSVICKDGAKPMALCHFIKEKQFKKVLCFTESVQRAQRLHLVLSEMALLQVREISSNNTPVQRKIILGQFASGKVDVIVCSDLVARGMDIEGVDLVVSYDVPQYVQAFVHRIGRTARAGKGGTAVTLLTKGEIPSFKKLIKTADIPMPIEVFIEDKDLESYLSAFQNALSAADSKVR